jgi:hypothetical protein
MSSIGATVIKCFANIGSLVLKFKENTCRQHGHLVRFLSFRRLNRALQMKAINSSLSTR